MRASTTFSPENTAAHSHEEDVLCMLDSIERMYGSHGRVMMLQTFNKLHANLVDSELGRFLKTSEPQERDGNTGLRFLPIECGENGSWVKVRGKEYVFTGSRQCRLISYLYKNLLEGKEKIPVKRTLASVGFSESINTIPKAFSKSKKPWDEVIGYGDGFCWLKK